ncbi:hypothetical protein K439DRAFT_1362476 [Ramaria rubella]|nr:hypothetical protein K439DRAFT_1362476 [Ramaria rubella]
MASKIISPFVSPLSPSAIDEWLRECEDGFHIYMATKTEKAPDLRPKVQICLTGTQLQEPLTTAWWSGRKEFLKLTTWEMFEMKIQARFMPKGYRLITLHTLFLCTQGKLPLLKFASALTEACDMACSTAVTTTIHKYQLLFHSHTILLLHIMALLDLNLNDISIDDLTALNSMQ